MLANQGTTVKLSRNAQPFLHDIRNKARASGLQLLDARFQELVSSTLQPDFTPDGMEVKEPEKATGHFVDQC